MMQPLSHISLHSKERDENVIILADIIIDALNIKALLNNFTFLGITDILICLLQHPLNIVHQLYVLIFISIMSFSSQF
ncbi:hypothetical protein FGO68_gene7796 [Halteria grandinella]|uniref:Uncharacterized protein n=1 Tax=Halteria grandinella TaxID=5974 RepID=A0A8J8SYY7_HALGN|nr:hypothetical protein FGO68_gene7796 [Halteria grandinella]